MKPALVPKHVTPTSSASRHSPREVGLAVVEDDRAAGEETADEEVPHHPAGRGEPEEAVVRRQVASAAASSSGARSGCRPGPARSPWAARWCRTSRGPRADGRTGPARTRAERARPAARPSPTGPSRCARATGSPAAISRDALAAVEVLAAVAVAVGREQHLRLDLGEAVDHGRDAELRRAARPDRADARRGQQRDDGLRRVRQVGHHAVAAPDPEPAQPARRSAPPGRSSSSQETSAGARSSPAWTIAGAPGRRHA